MPNPQPIDLKEAEEAVKLANVGGYFPSTTRQRLERCVALAIAKTRQEADAAGYARGRAEGDAEGAGRVVKAVEAEATKQCGMEVLPANDGCGHERFVAAARAAAEGASKGSQPKEVGKCPYVENGLLHGDQPCPSCRPKG